MSLLLLLMLPADIPAAGLPELADLALPKVVKIFGAGGFRGLPSYSTGCLVSSDGHIVTIWNHVLDTDRVTVVLDDGRRRPAELLGADPELDVAVLKIEGENLPFFDVTAARRPQSGRIQSGQRVLCLSNMYKVAEGNDPVSVQIGMIAAVTDLSARRGRNPIPFEGEALIVDAVTGVAGAGGGAVVDLDGNLVGLLGREVKGQQTNAWINYAAPIGRIAPIIERIVSGEFVVAEPDEPPPSSAGEPSRLGLTVVPNVVPRTPAYIERIDPDTDAATAGLQPDDLIVSLDGELVPSIAELRDLLSGIEPGVRVEVVVRRGAELVSVTLRTQ